MVHHHKLECLAKRHTPVIKVKFHSFLSFVPSKILLSALKLLPWYNCTGWLGVKHQLTYLLPLKFNLTSSENSRSAKRVCMPHKWPVNKPGHTSMTKDTSDGGGGGGEDQQFSRYDRISHVIIINFFFLFQCCQAHQKHPSITHSYIFVQFFFFFFTCTMLFPPLVPGNTVLSFITFQHIRLSWFSNILDSK